MLLTLSKRRFIAGTFAVLALSQTTACGRTAFRAETDNDSAQGAGTAGAPSFDAGLDAQPELEDASTRLDAAREDARAESCNAIIETHSLVESVHVTTCSPLAYTSNPPSSGNHYSSWAAFGEYDFAMPRGFWVHNLEHGAVVVSYNCPSGCENDLHAARAWLEAMLPDAYCAGRGGDRRILLLPDPLLDVPWAASAWGVTLRANCFDAETFQGFFNAHVGKGPENICAPGVDMRSERPSANCGQ